METQQSNTNIIRYDDKIVRMFVIATALWGLVGMLVGLIIAI
jgi:cytochrome c oxidase cbb3-type subunit I/II